MVENKKAANKTEDLSRINAGTVEIKKNQVYSRNVEVQEIQLRSAKVADAKSKLDSKSAKK